MSDLLPVSIIILLMIIIILLIISTMLHISFLYAVKTDRKKLTNLQLSVWVCCVALCSLVLNDFPLISSSADPHFKIVAKKDNKNPKNIIHHCYIAVYVELRSSKVKAIMMLKTMPMLMLIPCIFSFMISLLINIVYCYYRSDWMNDVVIFLQLKLPRYKDHLLSTSTFPSTSLLSTLLSRIGYGYDDEQNWS